MTISKFDGTEHAYMSNFFESPVTMALEEGGRAWTFPTSEHAFQAAKCPARAQEFTTGTPAYAKRLGRQVTLRGDWEDVKDKVMHDVVYAKFTQNPSIAERLLSTGDEELIEGNTWGDKYWGQVRGVGKNMLGKTLMRVREELRAEMGQDA